MESAGAGSAHADTHIKHGTQRVSYLRLLPRTTDTVAFDSVDAVTSAPNAYRHEKATRPLKNGR
jgi:hypothetical protein